MKNAPLPPWQLPQPMVNLPILPVNHQSTTATSQGPWCSSSSIFLTIPFISPTKLLLYPGHMNYLVDCSIPSGMPPLLPPPWSRTHCQSHWFSIKQPITPTPKHISTYLPLLAIDIDALQCKIWCSTQNDCTLFAIWLSAHIITTALPHNLISCNQIPMYWKAILMWCPKQPHLPSMLATNATIIQPVTKFMTPDIQRMPLSTWTLIPMMIFLSKWQTSITSLNNHQHLLPPLAFSLLSITPPTLPTIGHVNIFYSPFYLQYPNKYQMPWHSCNPNPLSCKWLAADRTCAVCSVPSTTSMAYSGSHLDHLWDTTWIKPSSHFPPNLSKHWKLPFDPALVAIQDQLHYHHLLSFPW